MNNGSEKNEDMFETQICQTPNMSRRFSILSLLNSFESLNVASIRQTATRLNIRLPARSTRSELKNILHATLARQVELDAKEAREAAAREEHRAGRCLALRQQRDPNSTDLTYPFEHIGYYNPVATPIIGHTELTLPPQWWATVEHYYWIHGGANDEEPWRFLARLTNGHYVFFIANCDYTGFDCQGDMKVWVAETPGILIMYGMSNADYDLFVKETVAV